METQKKQIAMIGGGSWATALVKILTDNGHKLNWWIREEDIIENIQRHGRNPRYLSSVDFDPSNLNISNDLRRVINSSDIIVFCVPSAFLKSVLDDLPKDALRGKTIVSAIKGIIPEINLIIGEFFNQEYSVSFQDFIVVCGPSHAEEVAQEKLTYLTVSSQNNTIAQEFCEILNSRYIKTSTSDDIFGTEYSAVLKNIYAIATGIAKGLGFGDNFTSVLISNALQETKRFIDTVHPIDRDLTNSVYLGDLLVTAYSQFSRNRTFGMMIGSGYSVKSAQLEMNMIAEGYYASYCIHQIKKNYTVDMPITEAVYNILYERISPHVEFRILCDKLS
ncbi:MAG: NAD(P)H-dependent glycerol-3-phosphate dehydrogenase [Bacteroidota bacterium]